MLRKLTVSVAGLMLALTLVVPVSASAATKPTPTQLACINTAKSALEAALAPNRTAGTAFVTQQAAQLKAFHQQQKAARDAFKATNPTDAQKKAFNEQQKAAVKAFLTQQMTAVQAFWAQQKAALTPALETFKASVQACLSQP